MKLFSNIPLWALCLLLVSNLFLSSCKKDKDEPAAVPAPLIATAKYYDSNGDLDYTDFYQYDDQGRLTKMESTDGYLLTMEHTPSAVTVSESQNGGMAVVSYVELDSKGLGTSITVNDTENQSIFFYDSKGYRESASLTTTEWITNDTYTVSDGNYVTILSTELPNAEKSAFTNQVNPIKHSFLSALLQKRISMGNSLKSAATYFSIKSSYVFYLDKANTIDSENRGILFLGKQNKNPIKQQIKIFTYFNESIMPQTITHTYEFDTKGRISKDSSSEDYFTLYTYVD
ncbi:MAG TPA: hypothetical protein VGK10_09315 [Prolixibacteraceae bacterium]